MVYMTILLKFTLKFTLCNIYVMLMYTTKICVYMSTALKVYIYFEGILVFYSEG